MFETQQRTNGFTATALMGWTEAEVTFIHCSQTKAQMDAGRGGRRGPWLGYYRFNLDFIHYKKMSIDAFCIVSFAFTYN